MGILNKLTSFKGKSSGQATENDDLPSLAYDSHAESAHTQRHHADDHDASIESEGLPSVNRRSGGGMFNVMGLVVIAIVGMVMMFSFGDNGGQQQQKETRKAEISNHLPPLDLPVPQPPRLLDTANNEVPPIKPVAVQANQPQLPHWSERKMAGTMLIEARNNAPIVQTAANGPAADSNMPNALRLSALNGNDKMNPADNMANLIGALNPKPEVPKEDLADKLKPTITQGVKAQLLPNRNFVITKGTALDCALETAIDTTVPGLITCRLTRDVYSDNGHVVMLDRGSQLVGEYKGGIKEGQARVFVLWTRAKTPNGIVIALDSPGTDALGRAGIGGWVDHHYAERFGAAILTSIIKDSFVIIGNAATRGDNSGNVISFGNTSDTSEKMGVEILRHTLNIPPTLHVNQGAHVQIMVARDLDFSSVYQLNLKP